MNKKVPNKVSENNVGKLEDYPRRSFNTQIGERDRDGKKFSTGRNRYGQKYAEPYFDNYEIYHPEEADEEEIT